MNLLKSPLEVDCPSCGAKASESCFYIHTPTGKKYNNWPCAYRIEALKKENEKKVKKEINTFQ